MNTTATTVGIVVAIAAAAWYYYSSIIPPMTLSRPQLLALSVVGAILLMTLYKRMESFESYSAKSPQGWYCWEGASKPEVNQCRWGPVWEKDAFR